VDDGFDFLGFNIRKYRGKLLIKPSKKNVKTFLDAIRVLIKSNRTAKQENLIYLLNPKIRGWSNYFRHVVSKGTFAYVDHCIFEMLRRWMERRHSEKSVEWRRKKYFRSVGAREEVFSVTLKDEKGQSHFLDHFRAAQVPICRHIKIRAEATPYDPQYKEYFLKREFLKRKPGYKDLKRSQQDLDSRDNHRATGSSNGLRKA
jgi:RNA-directed DNA polymerase